MSRVRSVTDVSGVQCSAAPESWQENGAELASRLGHLSPCWTELSKPDPALEGVIGSDQGHHLGPGE